MRAHAGYGGVGVTPGPPDLHVAIELLEALLARQLRAGRPKQPGQ
jgi:hypothetical protein